MTDAFKLSISPEGIAELKFDLPDEKVNTFSVDGLKELEQKLDEAAKNPNIKALKITSGKDESFIAGANLHAFEPAFKDPALTRSLIEAGHHAFSKLQNMPFPTIAVINGVCVGGGLEYALACTYRIVSDSSKVKLGLPEVTLGIFPGWGGTQRLPRLVGLQQALGMILGGGSVNAAKAYKMHLADAIASAPFLSEKADEFVTSILTKEGKAKIAGRRKKSVLNRLLEDNPLGRALVFSKARKGVLEKTKGHYPAPLIALDVIKRSYALPLDEGLKIEANSFTGNVGDGFKIANYLIGLFFIQEAAKKDIGVDKSAKPIDVKSAAVIGAGTMGAGIAWLLADHMIITRLKDISWELTGKGIGAIRALFQKGVKAKKITKCDAERRFQLVSSAIDYSGFDHAELIIEAATENLELKKKIFAEVETIAKPNAIIASNTSSLTITEMSQGMKHPERFVGMHFFNPVQKMPLVEVVGGKSTSPEAVATVVSLCRKLGKVPIVVGDCPGFLVNRILMMGANEAMFMLEEGYTMEDIDKALLDFGMPMGSFILSDEVGNDVGYKVLKTLEHAYGERMRPAKLTQLMYDKQLFGKKTGKGFYLYQGKEMKPNPEIKDLIQSFGPAKTHLPKEDIIPRFIYSMVNEAARCLEEKIISRADLLDLCLIMGIGFPPFRGGLLRYADEIGAAPIVSELKRFEKELGPRFKPCNNFEQMAQAGQTFYQQFPLKN